MDIAKQFNEKYPFSDLSWVQIGHSSSCHNCGEEMMSGEVALDGRICTSCGVKKFNESKSHNNSRRETPKIQTQTKYVESDPHWMILNTNYCYFCGHLEYPCTHMKGK